jgi:hypothetical protein
LVQVLVPGRYLDAAGLRPLLNLAPLLSWALERIALTPGDA